MAPDVHLSARLPAGKTGRQHLTGMRGIVKNVLVMLLSISGLATPVNDALIDAAQNEPEAAIAMMLGWGFGSAGHLHQGPIPGNSMEFRSLFTSDSVDAVTFPPCVLGKIGHSSFLAEARARTL